MRILFICGSLESGSDGVGDYTKRLATEIIKKNHEAAILAINDQFINTKIECTELVDNAKLQICRIPSNSTSTTRYKIASSWIDTFSPEWLSLQYVPFSFNPKGIPLTLHKNLSKFNVRRRHWHIMFHELWVGMEEESTIKHKLWGYLQRYLIKKLIQQLQPSLITTQTKLYQIQLEKLGYNAEYLPLFSNIPIKGQVFRPVSNEQRKIIFVNFGTIHPGAPIESFAKEAALYKQKKNVEFDLILIGRCAKEQSSYWRNVWESAGLNITILGEQPPDQLSQVFNYATFGISTTALPLIEKSGSVAAMQEHNLPVICIAKPWHPTGVKNLSVADGVIQYLTGNFEGCLTKEINVSYTDVSEISEQLVKKISSFN